VVFGPDHFRNFFYDVMPPFCIGAESVGGFGDYGTTKGVLPGAPRIAKYISTQVLAAGFDPAISLNMCVDHGIVQPFSVLSGGLPVSLIPVMINCGGAPMPALRRCYEFGAAIGRAVRSFPEDERVLVIGSGGLSHFLPPLSADNPSVPPELRDYLINGRTRAGEFNREREASSLKRRAEAGTGPVNITWDEWFLQKIFNGQYDEILDISSEELEETAGTGAHELRCWLSALGMWNGPVSDVTYEPVPLWVTGMGCVAAFEDEIAIRTDEAANFERVGKQ
jgi:2,3-dihydroxyphenylpropionate 1,2-dioxygenase